ncbi:DUF5123 domain-containing protein [Desertivirga xinjiangensis]|uniref:DUF5123 domain-containing protein n=1 Tax=Desertivirga xinjiangensis TaxID=539206 RepID=UPI00210C78AF|nr:DUF5123 domain-containing protein [Pedobacter xinjiangensis]
MKAKTLTLLTFTVALITIFTSCEKALGPDPKYYVPSPTISNIVSKETSIDVQWEYSTPDNRVVNFVTQLSLDKNFTTIFKSDTVDATARSTSFEGVNLVNEYFVRIRAIASDMVESSPFVSKVLTLESIFSTPERIDIQATSAKLKWTAPATGTVTHIVVIPMNSAPMSPIQLSATDIANKSITISNLSGATRYSALIYEGEVRKGVVTFMTRDVNEKITINSGSTVYETIQDAVNAAVSGDIIYFGGAAYDFSSTALSTVTVNGKSLTFKAALNSTVTPSITMKNFDLKGNISNFTVSGLKIISISKANTAGNTDYNKHVFGLSYVTGPLNLTIENSDISGAESGLAFSQTVGAASAPSAIPGTGTFNITIDNCLLHDFGNAGGDFLDFRSGTVGNINYKNTTFWNGARAFFRIDATASILTGAIIKVENSTFYNFSNGGIFLRTAAPGTAFVLNNNIIMNKISNNGNSIGGTGSTLKLNNNNISGTNAGNITGGVTSGFNIGTTALDPTFTNPTAGNFTVGNAAVKTAAQGDPRWL